jgi:hypothetical protein
MRWLSYRCLHCRRNLDVALHVACLPRSATSMTALASSVGFVGVGAESSRQGARETPERRTEARDDRRPVRLLVAEKLGPGVRLLPAEDVEAGWREKRIVLRRGRHRRGEPRRATTGDRSGCWRRKSSGPGCGCCRRKMSWRRKRSGPRCGCCRRKMSRPEVEIKTNRFFVLLT